MGPLNEEKMSIAMRRLFMIPGALAFVVIAWRLGAFEIFADPIRVKETLIGLGVMGYLAFVLGFGFIQPFGVPGTVFIIGASLVWPLPIAIVLSVVGAIFSTINGFSFARYVARDWVERKLPSRFRKYDDKLAERGFVTVFLLRMVFWTAPTLHLAMGVSRVRFWTHLAASTLAYIPVTIVISIFGDRAFALLRDQPRERWFWALALIATLLVAFFVGRALRKRKALPVNETEVPSSE